MLHARALNWLLLGTIWLVAPAVYAADIGVNFGFSEGEGDARASVPGYDWDADIEYRGQQLNFVVNACEQCEAFNYRLHLGINAADVEYKLQGNSGGTGWGQEDALGLNVDNTFGVKVFTNSRVNVWLGGTLYMSALELDGDFSNEQTGWSWGVGPTLGVDVRLDDVAKLLLEVGARRQDMFVDSDLMDDRSVEDLTARISIAF